MEKTAVGELRNLDRKEKQLEENKKKLVERRDTFKEKYSEERRRREMVSIEERCGILKGRQV